jgi:hypothetical protein
LPKRSESAMLRGSERPRKPQPRKLRANKRFCRRSAGELPSETNKSRACGRCARRSSRAFS